VLVMIDQRWCWTADRSRLVPDGHPDAAFLAYTPGTEIPEDEARKAGLLPAPGPAPVTAPPGDEPDSKAIDKLADKSRRAAPNK
jgi:hypothetical protein